MCIWHCNSFYGCGFEKINRFKYSYKLWFFSKLGFKIVFGGIHVKPHGYFINQTRLNL